MEGGLPATSLLGQGSLYPWAPPAEQGPGLGFLDPPGPDEHALQPPAPLPTKARVLGPARPSTALASTR